MSKGVAARRVGAPCDDRDFGTDTIGSLQTVLVNSAELLSYEGAVCAPRSTSQAKGWQTVARIIDEAVTFKLELEFESQARAGPVKLKFPATISGAWQLASSATPVLRPSLHIRDTSGKASASDLNFKSDPSEQAQFLSGIVKLLLNPLAPTSLSYYRVQSCRQVPLADSCIAYVDFPHDGICTTDHDFPPNTPHCTSCRPAANLGVSALSKTMVCFTPPQSSSNEYPL
ncbi:hypothetical protein H4582DRAFT_2076017 [Lactarius indigo]|nr:hypothetical protein H4582DRAFT_2076017 [Lactarius indigo]